ncbi:hypothetical protein Tco_1216696 [Tanacetum coccineum]
MLTDQVDWTNPEGDQVRIDVNRPLLLGDPPGHVTILTQFFFNKDLEYLRYGSKGSSHTLSISKMKAASYLDFGLELLVSKRMLIDDVCTYDISAKYGISHWWFKRHKFYIDRHDSPSRRKEVRHTCGFSVSSESKHTQDTEHPSDTKVLTMKMEILLEPTSNKLLWVFNSLVHSLRALSTLRRSGLRTASAAAKPCQGDSLEFSLITGRIPDGSGYHQKDRKPSQNDKTEHGMEKTVQNQGQSYHWKPTGRIFPLGDQCPLTRITKPKALPVKQWKPTGRLIPLDGQCPLVRPPAPTNSPNPVASNLVVQIVLWYLDSGCSKHMTGDRSRLRNFIEKFNRTDLDTTFSLSVNFVIPILKLPSENTRVSSET